MATKLNWTEIWERFDVLYAAAKSGGRCNSCNRMHEAPDWDEQQKMIEKAVNQQLARLQKKK